MNNAEIRERHDKCLESWPMQESDLPRLHQERGILLDRLEAFNKHICREADLEQRIKELESEIIIERGFIGDWRKQVIAARNRIKELEAQLAEKEMHRKFEQQCKVNLEATLEEQP